MKKKEWSEKYKTLAHIITQKQPICSKLFLFESFISMTIPVMTIPVMVFLIKTQILQRSIISTAISAHCYAREHVLTSVQV